MMDKPMSPEEWADWYWKTPWGKNARARWEEGGTDDNLAHCFRQALHEAYEDAAQMMETGTVNLDHQSIKFFRPSLARAAAIRKRAEDVLG